MRVGALHSLRINDLEEIIRDHIKLYCERIDRLEDE